MQDKTCPHCGFVFIPKRKNQKYCKKKCTDRASAKRTGADKRWSNTWVKKNWRKKRYGVEAHEWEDLKVSGCSICGSKEGLVVDHDHITELVCGCLCQSCNKGLGFFRESVELLSSAIDYLKKTEKTPKE